MPTAYGKACAELDTAEKALAALAANAEDLAKVIEVFPEAKL